MKANYLVRCALAFGQFQSVSGRVGPYDPACNLFSGFCGEMAAFMLPSGRQDVYRIFQPGAFRGRRDKLFRQNLLAHARARTSRHQFMMVGLNSAFKVPQKLSRSYRSLAARKLSSNQF